MVDQQRWVSLPPEPRNVEDVLRGSYAKEWRAILQLEFDNPLDRNNWELKDVPRGRRNLGVKWLLKRRTKVAEVVDTIKTRLMDKGYTQIKTADFNDSSAANSRFTLLRVLVTMTVIGNCDLSQKWSVWCQTDEPSSKPARQGPAQEDVSPLYLDQIIRCQDIQNLTAVNPHCKLMGYSDAHYEVNGVTMSGVVFLLEGTAVAWASTVCPKLWSTETELIATIWAVGEAMDLRALLQEVGYPQTQPTTLIIDNSVAMNILMMEKRLGPSKQSNKLRWLRRVVREKIVRLVYVDNNNQATAFMEEDFSKTPFGRGQEGMGLHLKE